MKCFRILAACAMALALVFPWAAPAQKPERWTLTILHSNDTHSRLQAVNRFDSTCTDKEKAEKQCFGGMARLAHKAHEILDEVKAAKGNALFLDAGDPFQGSLFYTHYKGKAELAVMNLMRYDAMAIGNHEFDDGPKPLAEFIRGARFPVVSANIRAANDRDLAGRIRSSVVVTRGGRKIGIVGVTTEDTPSIANPGPNIRFVKAETALRPVIDRLRRDGVDIIVALSHLGLARDKEIAAAVEGIDVIVGGHSHTLLSNSIQGAAGPYPVVAKSPRGSNVLIVQAYAYTRYLGRIDVTFDRKGVAHAWSGDPIPLVQDIPEDPKVAAEIARLAGPLEAVRTRVIGAAAADLVQANCRKEECLMGSVIADAILDKVKHLGVTAAIQNGGGVRAAIGKGEVTMGHVLTVLPFQNVIATMGIKGSDLVAALENGVGGVETGAGRFPQVAGMRYVWDPAAPAGKRIVAVEMSRADGSFAPLDPGAIYKIATNEFMRRGGDGYTIFRDRAIDPYDFGPGLEDTVAAYIQTRSPIAATVEGRIRTK
jgi:5'-nucleotidase